MAETVLPSVRGRKRIQIHLALTGGAMASAGLAGFAIGLVVQGVLAVTGAPDAASWWLAVVAAGVVLDGIRLIVGRPAPLTLGRQVPQEWGRLLPLPLTAVLYGARLGVGPLTILSTWMWWSMLVAASLIGVWTAVAVSMWFALSRMLLNGGVAFFDSAAWNRSLIRFRRVGWGGLTTAAGALVAVVALTSCSVVEGERPTLLAYEISSESVTEPTIGSSVFDPDPRLTPWTTQPAQLEDVVRTQPDELAFATDDEPGSAGSESTTTTAEPPTATEYALARLLPSQIDGMTVVDDPTIDRFLNIDEAAAIQPDPTEEIALLETRGYRGGWIRAFRSEESDVAVAAVYEFRNPAEAEFYLEDGLITIGGYGGEFFDIPQLPGVRGFQQELEDDGETVRTLGGAFFHEHRWHLLYLVGAPATVTPEALIPALQTYYSSAVGEATAGL